MGRCVIGKKIYQTPSIKRMGSFEALTQGQGFGIRFDGSFIAGQPVPLDPDGHALVLS